MTTNTGKKLQRRDDLLEARRQRELEPDDPAQPAPLATLTTVDCPACDGNEPCDECQGQGKVVVARVDMGAQQAQASAKEGGAA